MKNILILGANSDVSRAIVHEFATKGYSFSLGVRNPDELVSLQNDIKIRYNADVDVYAFDALDFSGHQKFYEDLKTKPSITICVFGLLGDQKVAEKDWKACEKIIHTNYTGAVSILNVVAEDYEKRKEGVIVGISSVAGERGRQSNFIYGSAKAGFTAYLSGLRNRLYKSGVHVVTVKPGFIDTKMTEGLNLPKPITAKPPQVAKAVYNAVQSRKNTIYVLSIWKLIMLIIKLIPEGVFKKLKL